MGGHIVSCRKTNGSVARVEYKEFETVAKRCSPSGLFWVPFEIGKPMAELVQAILRIEGRLFVLLRRWEQ